MHEITMVVIDHNVAYIEEIKRKFMLEHELKLVDTAITAQEGLSKVQMHKPSVVVFSHTLPDDDGMQFLQKLSSIVPQSIKLVILEVDNPVMLNQYIHAGALSVAVRTYYTADKLIEMVKMLSKSMAPAPGPQGFSNPTPNYGAPQTGFSNPPNNFSQPQYGNTFPQQNNMPGQGFQQPTQEVPNNFQPGAPVGAPPVNNFGPVQQQPWAPAGQQQFSVNNDPGNMSDEQYQSNNPFFANKPHPQHKVIIRSFKQQVIAINSQKGGVGKSTISVNLSTAFSQVNMQGQPLKICLVDLDLEKGDDANLLNKNPYPNMTVWASDIKKRLMSGVPETDIKYSPQQIFNNYLISVYDNFKLLAAPTNQADALDITGKEIEIIIENLKNCNFDIIILDTGNNITSDASYVSLIKANKILMIVTLETTTINDIRSALNTLRTSQVSLEKINLVLNKQPKNMDFSIEEVETTLEKKIMARIPDFGDKVRVMNNLGKPLMTAGDNEFTLAIKELANTINPVFNRKIENEKPQGLFKRFFGGKK